MKDIRIAYAVAFVSVLALLGWAGWKVVSAKGEAAQVNQVVSVQITEGEHASVDESKTAGYRNADEAARSRGVEQIWDQMADMIAEEDSGKAASATDSRAMNEEKAMKALLGEEAPAPAPAQKQSSGSVKKECGTSDCSCTFCGAAAEQGGQVYEGLRDCFRDCPQDIRDGGRIRGREKQ